MRAGSVQSHNATKQASPGAAPSPAAFLAGALAAGLLALTACAADDGDEAAATKPMRAEISWTVGGIPHIVATDWRSAGFGSGYAFARHGACVLADQVVKVRGERARYFGPGKGDRHIESDFYQHFARTRARADAQWPKVHKDVKDLLTGFAAGYNEHLRRVGPAGLPARCREAAWVRPIEALDIFLYMMDIAQLASTRAIPSLGPVQIWAQPPKQAAQALPAPGAPDAAFSLPDVAARAQVLTAALQGALLPGTQPAIGSNGIAIGAKRSADGRGMVLGNPHFPWSGELRFWQLHVTIPGVYDVAGAGLSGSPIPNIGFGRDLAWTHTVSKSAKFTAYRLQIAPGDPTSYLHDGKVRPMTATTATVDVLQPDGTLVPVTRTYYRSHHGPIVAIPGLADWTTTAAFAIRDANDNNGALMEHFLRVGQARSIAELAKVMATVQANPWVNTIAADRHGQVFYSESSSVPNLSPAAYAAAAEAVASGDVLAGLLRGYGFHVLDGSTSRDDWVDEPGAREPGLVPFARTPHLQGDDYVANANESHWLTNAATPLTGYDEAFGDEGGPRSLRTRVVLREVLDQGEGSAAGADGRFTLDELAAIRTRERSLGAELVVPALLQLCADVTVVTADGKDVAIGPGCQAIQGWDRRLGVASKGALLLRETLAAFAVAYGEGLRWDDLFAVPFDAAAPTTTPHTALWQGGVGKPTRLAQGFAAAVARLQAAKIPLDAELGQWQYVPRGKDKVAIPGGMGPYGAFDVCGYASGRDTTLLGDIPRPKVLHGTTGLTGEGYVVNYGSSFVMAVGFDDKGPVGKQILTYSQSPEPDSPHHRDQTDLYSQGGWLPIVWDAAAIAAARVGEVEVVVEP